MTGQSKTSSYSFYLTACVALPRWVAYLWIRRNSVRPRTHPHSCGPAAYTYHSPQHRKPNRRPCPCRLWGRWYSQLGWSPDRFSRISDLAHCAHTGCSLSLLPHFLKPAGLSLPCRGLEETFALTKMSIVPDVLGVGVGYLGVESHVLHVCLALTLIGHWNPLTFSHFWHNI